MTPQEKKQKGIAAIITCVIVALIFLALFFLGMSWDPKLLAASSIPEIAPDEEELFIEPEFIEQNLERLGEENSEKNDEPAPQQLGEPEKAEKENNKVVEPGENPKPAPQKPKLNTQTKESNVKAQDPSKTKEEKQKVTSSMAGKFSGQNGKTDGKNSSSGAGGEGSGLKGNLKGRKLINCPMPQVKIRNKVVVTVTLTVNEQGKVVGTPSATGGGSTEVQKKCIAAAKQAKWEPKPGAGNVIGTITFTIIPK